MRPVTAVCLLFAAAPALADPSPAFLVKDVNALPHPAPLDIVSLGIHEFGGLAWFTATRPATGSSEWRSDGTAAGTIPGFDFDPRLAAEIDDTVFFARNDGVHGSELWKSDGTLEGTELVKDLNPGSAGSDPSNLTSLNGTLFFSASAPSASAELWKSDGTEAGTVMVKQLTGVAGSSVGKLTAVGDTLYFAIETGTSGAQLWKSDGTGAGTVLVKTFETVACTTDPPCLFIPDCNRLLHLTAVGDVLFFTSYDSSNGRELWKSDGTEAGTVRVKDVAAGLCPPSPACAFPGCSSNPQDLVALNGSLFFSADDGVHGRELWKSDGTEAGTVLVKDIIAGPVESLVAELVNAGGTLFFRAADFTNGSELWKSDGTEAGTVLVADVAPGPGNAQPTEITAVGSLVFFRESGSSNGGLWKSDGTAAGTLLLTGDAQVSANQLANVDGTLFFEGTGANGAQLWKSDGTPASTLQVTAFVGSGDATPVLHGSIGDTFFFAADDGLTGHELWKSDGTAAGTVLVKDIYPGPPLANGSGRSLPFVATRWNGALYFNATDADHGAELWKSDGTEAGTVLVKDIRPGTAGSSPFSFVAVDDELFFLAFTGTASGQTGRELWKTDGTEAGTVLVKDIASGTASSNPHSLVELNGTLYFAANNVTNGDELWRSDGTAAGTVLVKDILPGSQSSGPTAITVMNGSLFFAASSGVIFGNPTDRELWKSDGTSAGTVELKDLAVSSSNPVSLTNVNGTLFFVATAAADPALWKSDGTEAGTVFVADPGLTPDNLTNVNGRLFFAVDDGTHGKELWKSDGTSAGTVLVEDIFPGSGSSLPQAIEDIGGVALLLVRGDFGLPGRFWVSDGTAAGTHALADGAPPTPPGPGGYPFGALEFRAFDTDETGDELFAVPVAAITDGDGDGLDYLNEIALGTDPNVADTDGDGLPDGDEVNTHGTNPLAADTDGDGFDDGDELVAGTNPLDPLSFPASVPVTGLLGAGALAALLLATGRRRAR